MPKLWSVGETPPPRCTRLHQILFERISQLSGSCTWRQKRRGQVRPGAPCGHVRRAELTPTAHSAHVFCCVDVYRGPRLVIPARCVGGLSSLHRHDTVLNCLKWTSNTGRFSRAQLIYLLVFIWIAVHWKTAYLKWEFAGIFPLMRVTSVVVCCADLLFN